MASIAALVSEIAHSLKQPNNTALRENLKLLILHTRNELIRHSYEQHGYVDKMLVQRFMVDLITINDGELVLPEGVSDIEITKIKRTKSIVPIPIRLTNNLPFDSVRSAGFRYNVVFPFIKETAARFRSSVPGLNGMTCYDYINGYIYLFPTNNNLVPVDKIVIESAFANPTEIDIINGKTDDIDNTLIDNEFLLSEDMIGNIKDIIYKRDLLSNVRETNEEPNSVKFN